MFSVAAAQRLLHARKWGGHAIQWRRQVCIEEGRENEFIHIAEGFLEAQHCINAVALREKMARQAKTEYSGWSNDDIKCAIAHVLDDTQGKVWFKHELIAEVFKRIPSAEKGDKTEY